MITITRENAEIKSFITGFLSDAAHDKKSSNSLLANVFRIALASLEAEPVAWKATFTQIDNEYNTFTALYSDKAEVERWVRLHEIGDFRADITPLYAAPPAQAQCIEVAVNDDMAYAFHHALSDSSPGADEVEEIKTGLRAAFANVTVQLALIVPDEIEPGDSNTFDYVDDWNACRAAMLQAGNFRENKNSSTNNFREISETSTCSPVIPAGWISCSERMPDDGQHVIILCDGAYVLYAQYRDSEFFDVVRNGEEFFETQSRNVTHWMPLPEPPQEVK